MHPECKLQVFEYTSNISWIQCNTHKKYWKELVKGLVCRRPNQAMMHLILFLGLWRLGPWKLLLQRRL